MTFLLRSVNDNTGSGGRQATEPDWNGTVPDNNILLDMYPGTADHISLEWPALPGWTDQPAVWQSPEQTWYDQVQGRQVIQDVLIPVQNLVRKYHQTIRAYQSNILPFHQAVQDFRSTGLPVLRQAVLVCWSDDNHQTRSRLNQAIQHIQQAGQQVADASAAVNVSRQAVISAGQGMRQAIQNLTDQNHPGLEITEQDMPGINLDVQRLKQEIRQATDFRNQVIRQAEQAVQEQQQVQAETDQVIQQANQVIQAGQNLPVLSGTIHI